MVVTIERLPFQGGLADPYLPPELTVLGLASQVWIDLTFPYIAGAKVYADVMAAKKIRYYLGGDIGSGGLRRLYAAVDLDVQHRLNAAIDEITKAAAGKTVHITCPRGSDFTFTLEKPAYAKPRRASNPGHYLTPCSSTMFPVLESVRGTLVFTAVFHEYFTALPEPLRITVDSVVRTIDGPASQRAALDRALRRAGNGKYGHLIHFTYAVSPTARATGRSFIEDSRVLGSNAVGMGLPWWIPGGGENHPDGVLSDQSIRIGDLQLVERGAVVAPQLLDLAAALSPRVPPARYQPATAA